MKRSGPIRRKTPMPARKARLKPVSKKTATRRRAARPFREKYLAAHYLCEVCCNRPAIEVHEITRGPARDKSLDVWDAVLAVCRTCHRSLESHREWPPSRQLALKAIRSERVPDLQKICELRGEADTAFVWADLAKHLELKA